MPFVIAGVVLDTSLMVGSGSICSPLYNCAAAFSPANDRAEVVHLPSPATVCEGIIIYLDSLI